MLKAKDHDFPTEMHPGLWSETVPAHPHPPSRLRSIRGIGRWASSYVPPTYVLAER